MAVRSPVGPILDDLSPSVGSPRGESLSVGSRCRGRWV